LHIDRASQPDIARLPERSDSRSRSLRSSEPPQPLLPEGVVEGRFRPIGRRWLDRIPPWRIHKTLRRRRWGQEHCGQEHCGLNHHNRRANRLTTTTGSPARAIRCRRREAKMHEKISQLKIEGRRKPQLSPSVILIRPGGNAPSTASPRPPAKVVNLQLRASPKRGVSPGVHFHQ